MLNFRSYSDLARTIHNNLPSIAVLDFDLIVGMPRSGMDPAYMIGLDLNIPVCSFYDLKHDNDISRDSVRKIKNDIKFPREAKKILIVEDSYNTGRKLQQQVASLSQATRNKLTTLAIYSAVEKPSLDMFFEVVPQPRFFEWNVMHHNFIAPNSCFDMDGVLCEDPTEEENDDGKNYLNFILNARPKFIPSYTIKTIVTSRLEKYRKPTETWLAKQGVVYEKLLMLEGHTAESRRASGVHGLFKAEEYKKEEYVLFLESNRRQAEEIHKITDKPVYCVDTNELLQKENNNDHQTNTNNKANVDKTVADYRKNKILVRKFARIIRGAARYGWRAVRRMQRH